MKGKITADIERYLTTSGHDYVDHTEPLDEAIMENYGSVREGAAAITTTVSNFIKMYPRESKLLAESNYQKWSKALGDAIIKGQIEWDGGVTSRLTKNHTDLFKIKIDEARNELEFVERMLTVMRQENDSKQSQIVSVLYDSALRGDVAASKYLIDRVEGKIGESESLAKDDWYKMAVYQIITHLTKQQLKVLHAGIGAVMAVCGRRSGKTELAVSLCLISVLSTPNMRCVYVGKTAEQTEMLFDGVFNDIVNRFNLTDKKGNRLNWRKLDNGSKIIVRGLSTLQDPDIIRGLKAEVIVMDEFFHMKSELLQYMMRDVLGPMQMDYAKTFRFLMIGSPPPNRGTYAEKIYNENDFPKFTWTYRENPYIEDGDEYVKHWCKINNVPFGSPAQQREFDAIFVYDTDFMLFPEFYEYTPTHLPNINVSNISIGIDYGQSDSTAVIAVCWDNEQNLGYIFYEAKFNMLTTGGQAELSHLKDCVMECWIKALDYFPGLSKREANRRITWSADYNGGMKMITQELVRDTKLKSDTSVILQIADAHREDSQIVNDKIKELFRSGALLLPKGSKTSMECLRTVFKKDMQGNPTRVIDDQQFHPDLLDALRYAMYPLVGNKNIEPDSTFMLNSPEVAYGGSFEGIDFKMSKEPLWYEDKNGTKIAIL